MATTVLDGPKVGSGRGSGSVGRRTSIGKDQHRYGGIPHHGRSNAPTFALRWFTSNILNGATRNPLNPALTPGGSTGGGAAAVTAGIGHLAVGTDIGAQIMSSTGLIARTIENGIAAIKNRDEIKPLGAFPDAEFLVVFKLGFDAGEHLTGEILGVAPHRDLGIIHMQQIAPTVAGILGVDLINAKAPPLNLKP